MAKMSGRLFVPWLVLSFVPGVTCSRPAAAQTPQDRTVTAELLFQEARRLAEDNRWDEVCPKLEASQSLDPNMLTVYRLADCYEHVGRTASARELFLKAAAQARAAHQEARANAAEARAGALEPRLTYMVITPISPTADLLVSIGGTLLPRSRWGVRTPMDPGSVVVRALATDKKPFETTVEVKGDGAIVSVSIPALQPEEPLRYWPADAYPGADTSTLKPVTQDQQARRSATHEGSSRRTAGAISFLLGMASIATGAVWIATNGPSDSCSFDQCGVPVLLLVSGAAAATVGAVLWISGRDESSAVAVGPGSLVLRGSF
jgi:hypothetical protein